MSRWSALFLLAAAAWPALAGASPKAFPTAEGFGARAVGGRGGRVILVTHRGDSGPGSFRAAVGASGPRTVIFRVAGYIDLASPVVITNPYLTIAGQSAPYGGVTLRGRLADSPGLLRIQTHDVVVRHIRIRPGPLPGPVDYNGLDVTDGTGGGAEVHDVIVDHVSVSWQADEGIALHGDATNLTIQWCSISEGLLTADRMRDGHGLLATHNVSAGGTYPSRVSIHHNLFAHDNKRNPQIAVPGLFDVVNNVIYDFGERATTVKLGDTRMNYVGNYVKPGPSSRTDTEAGRFALQDFSHAVHFVYDEGNVVESPMENVVAIWNRPTRLDPSCRRAGAMGCVEPVPRFTVQDVATTSAIEASSVVPTQAGALRTSGGAYRDAVDARLISDYALGTGRIIADPDEVGGWPALPQGSPYLDRDGDGMDDLWERAHGLDAVDPRDQNLTNAEGYTMLEVFLSELAGD